jgi:hypothetical protein
MTHIQLRRSGGQIGKTLQASMEIDMDEKELVKQLKEVAPVQNPLARDAFSYNIIVNEKKTYPINITQLKGKLKKLISKMEDGLTP